MSALSVTPEPIELVGTLIFLIALIHTFSTSYFQRLAVERPAHAGLWHLLGEVEVVFGFWAMVLALAMVALKGTEHAVSYLDGLSYTEPLFVFAIMIVAGSRPVLQLAMVLVRALSRVLPMPASMSVYFLSLSLVPLLGSFITEPAAMTLAAMILRDHFLARQDLPAWSVTFKYATLGVLFVNVSIGGTLTSFAAPPVLMVASTWQWDVVHMLTHFGWKAALAVLVNAGAVTLLMRRQLLERSGGGDAPVSTPVPPHIMAVHLAFLATVVVFAHHPPVFIGLLLFFIGFTHAYPEHQDPLILREGLLVAFFLGGLVVLGGLQKWWLQDLLAGMSDLPLFFGATALTAVTDNAALTYLGSLIDGTSAGFQYALVAGAVTGGGLTVVANAPNPAGLSLLKPYFPDETVRPLGLLAAAALPTLVAVFAFLVLGTRP